MTDTDSFQRPAGDTRHLHYLELHAQQVRPVRVGDVLALTQDGWLRIIGWTPLDNGHTRYVAERADDTPLTLHARGAYTLTPIPTA